MRKWLRPDWRARLLDLFACFLIPLYTLLFTHDTRWFTTIFSVIAAARSVGVEGRLIGEVAPVDGDARVRFASDR